MVGAIQKKKHAAQSPVRTLSFAAQSCVFARFVICTALTFPQKFTPFDLIAAKELVDIDLLDLDEDPMSDNEQQQQQQHQLKPTKANPVNQPTMVSQSSWSERYLSR